MTPGWLAKKVTRRLAIVAVVVLVLGGVESDDMDSSIVS
jgi:hypothetical protein